MSSIVDLQSWIQAVNPKHKACFEHTQGPWRTATIVIGTTSGLKSLIRSVNIGNAPGTPLELRSFILGVAGGSKDLQSIVICKGFTGFKDISAYIHIVNFFDIKANIHGYLSSYTDLLSSIRGKYVNSITDVGAGIEAIPYVSLRAVAKLVTRLDINLNSFIHGWVHDDVSISATIQPEVETDIGAFINIIQTSNLSAFLKVWPYSGLQSYIHGYATRDLRASVILTLTDDLYATIFGYRPSYLSAFIRGWMSGIKSVSAFCDVWHETGLPAIVNKCFYRSFLNLGSSIVCVKLNELTATIVGWAERFLSANLKATIPPWYLPATIVAHGGYRNLNSSIRAAAGVENTSNLSIFISGWGLYNLRSTISTIESANLSANVVSIGGTKNISASIKVKSIIFSEFYKFSTVNTADLRAYVGFSMCDIRTPRSAYATLLATLMSIPVYDLGATITGYDIRFSGSKSLSAVLNFTNKYSIFYNMSSFKISTAVSDAIKSNPAFAKNSLNLTFKIIDGLRSLKASIVSQPHNVSLSAVINSRLLIIHGRSDSKVLTEEMVEIEEYVKKWHAFVDVYLNFENPIFYTSGRVFATEYNKPLFSLIFKRNSSYGVEHSYVLDNDMFFDSTDAAVRYGLLKASGRMGMAGLQATVVPIIKSSKLRATIEGLEWEPMYIDSPFTYLKSGSISFMGTCINHIMYKSKNNVFGGIQDINSSISSIPI